MQRPTRREFIRSVTTGVSLTTLGFSLHSCSRARKPPNIILLLTDDQRHDALGCAGNPIIRTPNMDRLAREGVRFENAFVTTPICAASRASIFTGLYERTHGYTFGQPPISREYTDVSYPPLLRQAGYRTGFVGKFGVEVPEGVTEEWFDYFRPSAYPYFKEVGGELKHLTDINMDRAVEFLRETGREAPFCLSISTWAPHADDGSEEQYFWPRSCDGLYEDITIPPPVLSDEEYFESLPDFVRSSLNRQRWYWRFDDPEKYQSMVKGYYRMISGVDLALGRLLDELEYLGIVGNTVIIVTSDNGYFLGERGFAGKWTMHDTSIRVPLIVCDPRQAGSAAGRIRDEMVLNIDITPTILDLAGIVPHGSYQGRSLLPLSGNRSAGGRSEIFCEHLWDYPPIPQTECIRTTDWKYIRYPQHPDYEELYDLTGDPIEGSNLIDRSEHGDLVIGFRERCDRFFGSLP